MAAALIGRDHPAGILRAEISRAADSHGGLVLVTGEAGIGKTTLVTGAVDEARQQGALVLSGSCWDSESAPGYWPWMQVIRGLRRSATPEEWAAAEGGAGGGLKVLLGETPGTEASSDGFQLYDAVTTALVAVSQRRPVVVILDDLHWADTASVKLLEFAAQHTWFERLLLVGTYRDVEVEWAEHPLQSLMLPLVAKATTVTLTGLGRDEVGALMARTVGQEPDADLVTEVHLRTGGNPFFVEQTARLWRSVGSVSAVAPGVRDAVQRRLAQLPAPVVELLTAAAVLGREFHRQVLAATVASPVAHVDRLLDQAVAARLMVAAGGGRFAFAHDLVRETLYDSLDEAVARRWHAAVVRALDRSSALTERMLPAELARHAHLAGDDLEPTRAVDHMVAAARDASRRLACEEAIGHYRRALERAGDDQRRRALISLSLGGELYHAGDRDEGWQCFEQAVALQRELDDPQLLARIALTLYRYDVTGERERMRSGLLDQAHRLLVRGGSDAPEPLSANALAQELAVRVTGLARGGDDDEELAFSLWARHDAIWGPGTAQERLALCEEMIDVARRTGDPENELFANSLRWVALLELGDPRYLEQLHTFVELTQRDESPRWALGSFVDQSIVNTHRGRFAEAASQIDQVDAYEGPEDYGEEFVFMSGHIRWVLWLMQGRFEEIDGLLRQIADQGHPYPGLLEAVTAIERGDVGQALHHLTEFEDVVEPYPRAFAPVWLRFRAQAAAASRDPQLCERARAVLEPLDGQWMVSVYGCDVCGPVALWLGALDAAQERWADAIARFTAAYESADRLRARPWSVMARARLVQALLDRGAPEDAGPAAKLLDGLEREATELGMRQIVAHVGRMRSGAGVAEARQAPVIISADTFRFDGRVWTLSYGGQTAHMPDTKGLRDLHLLLGSPGTEIPAVRLLNPEGGEVVVAARQLGGDAILDEEAKAQYKRRLIRLDEEIDRAAELGDDRRAAEFDRERQALLDELRAAAGLAGRSRRLGDEAERARKTVTARIRDTLRKLDQGHPELAAHLRATVSTGATCVYRPNGETTWRL